MIRKPLLDADWAGVALLATPDSLSDQVNDARMYYTTSSRKFTDGSLGGSFEINPLPEFTANADLCHMSFFSASQTGGVGRWKDETITDNAQLIHIRPGVAKMNSMTTFFGNLYNVNMGAIVRTGREPGLMYNLGRVVGMVGTLPLQPFILGGAAIRFFAEIPRGKYYYHQPTTYPYWLTVQNMMNGFMSSMGMLAGFLATEQKRWYDPVHQPEPIDLTHQKRVLGNLVTKGGALDVFQIATKAQRLAFKFREEMEKSMELAFGGNSNLGQSREAMAKFMFDSVDRNLQGLTVKQVSLEDYGKAYLSTTISGKTGSNWATEAEMLRTEDNTESWWSQAADVYESERRMGSQFVTLRVNWTGSQSSSFSNSAGESSIQGQINSMSSKNRQIRFAMADGNISDGVFGKLLGGAITAAKDVLAGIAQSVEMSGFMVAAGNAFADIQRVYESSSADLNRTSFSINLKSWSHDDWVRVQTLYLPLAAILSLALPRATGAASYDGPFLLEVFNQGKSIIREGMFESLNIEVGDGDVGWSRDRKPLSINVTGTIVDLSSIMSLCVNPAVGYLDSIPGTVAGVLGGESAQATADAAIAAIKTATYSEDNKYTDWISTMASLPLEDIINGRRRWKNRMAQMRANLNSARSPAAIGVRIGDTLPGKFLQAISPETDRY